MRSPDKLLSSMTPKYLTVLLLFMVFMVAFYSLQLMHLHLFNFLLEANNKHSVFPTWRESLLSIKKLLQFSKYDVKDLETASGLLSHTSKTLSSV